MFTEFSHEYQTMELPNIVYAAPKGSGHIETVTEPFLLPLIEKVAKARPKWRLVGDQRRYTSPGGVMNAYRFQVVENGELLGVIKKDWFGSSDAFGVSNKRIADKRTRNDMVRTKDVRKAFKAVTQNFSTKTVTELVHEASRQASSAVSSVYSHARYPYIGAVEQLKLSMQKFAEDNWEAYVASLGRVDAEKAANFPAYTEAYKDAQRLSECWGDKSGYVVVLRGSEYIIHRNDQTGIMTTDTVPPHLKRGIGVLKLVEDGKYIAGIGVRVNANILYVMGEDSSGKAK